ncbi:MAG: AmmeMemoRadiSam system protein B, partial [Treponema sp.]|nr:AmmeMemoRadiSam system protein B [Treponema sp.]
MIALEERVRSPVAEGMFYPEYRAETLAYMRAFGLERGKGGSARVIIAPHGAWELSGAMAGAAFAAAGGRNGKKNPSRIVILGPVHDRREEGLFLTNSHFFQTPLGNIPVDQEAIAKFVASSPLFEINDIPHLQEHSIEVLLPFVKYYFPRASIVPILMGQPQEPLIDALACALRTICGPTMDNTLLVISCNLAVHSSADTAFFMAEECVRLFSEQKNAELSVALLDGRLISCGGGLIASLLQSGLVDSMHPNCVSHSLLSVQSEEHNTVC